MPATAPPPRYAYLGPAGTFTEAALRQVASPDEAQYLPQVDVVSALESVRAVRADYAVVPIENSVEGGVTATLDTLATGLALVLLREVLVPITFVLAGRPGTRLADVRRVSTHPHAWAQCRRWVNTHLPGVVHVPATSTAAAGALLADPAAGSGAAADPGFEAALVAPLTAELYGLEVLATQVADNERAVTRFVVVGRPGPVPAPTGSDKTSLVVHLPSNDAGALLEMLEQFAARGVNLSRIESRPIGDLMGRYSFSIDAEGHVAEERVAEALMGLHRVCPHVRFLGSYPRADGVAPRIEPGMTDDAFAGARQWVEDLRGGRAS
ncbi:prephenate dehydratase [Cellulomonas sp. ATA003]|uniref:prephenate dehydratase n=1 Tax=Cellulomonas sp. ATA003 TaxID=3073064 RepID=UPI002872DC6C|nr:prephenate dehydratase [Cellulomonas sp. ATA003]WNB85504.1 prephenate dehydratase [Cellulomonas sp. ATA003]